MLEEFHGVKKKLMLLKPEIECSDDASYSTWGRRKISRKMGKGHIMNTFTNSSLMKEIKKAYA